MKLRLAEATARLLRSEHATVRIGRDEFEELLDDFLRSMDQPTIDGLNTYLVSRAAANARSQGGAIGLGGDELFGGYPSFRQIPTLLKWGRRIPLPKSLGRAVEGYFPDAASAGSSAQGRRAAVAFRRYRQCLSFATRLVSRGRARCLAR